eukprot:6468142-Amphidinium_carterae.1
MEEHGCNNNVCFSTFRATLRTMLEKFRPGLADQLIAVEKMQTRASPSLLTSCNRSAVLTPSSFLFGRGCPR